jgi:hypothetical protein
MKYAAAALVAVCLLLPWASRASEISLGSMTCDQYENTLMNPPTPAAAEAAAAQGDDAVNVVMWLFGFAVAKSGAHAMYGNALQQFGNALDSECKAHPASSLLDSVAAVKLVETNPMDLATLGCTVFESRHADMVQSDPQSATTIMMWLYGFSVGKAGGHVINAEVLPHFSAALAKQCSAHPDASLYDALAAIKAPGASKASRAPKAPGESKAPNATQ